MNWRTWEWWKSPFIMTVRNRQTLEEVWQLPYTRMSVFLVLLGAFFFIFIICMLFAAWFFSPKNLIGKDETTRKLILINQTIDSLSQVVQTRDKYIQSIQKLLQADQEYLKNDFGTGKKEDEKKKKLSDSIDLNQISEVDKKLRKEIEQTDRNLVGLAGGSNMELREMFFFQPLKGLITEKYNAKEKHFGTDIVAEKDAPIKSVAEGTVIMASWTDDTGYVMMIQHQSKLISVYKHCSVLLKKTGDFVQAGEILAIIGNTGALTSGPHLHFEMWYEGNPINAEKLINF
ncbi:MAG: M23 family metallopeptidase [Bacteroidetes bacterium]|nr:MAG: M23 family metallopeptidase [Bacteroidota bacterium]TAG92702.1 MAG: M23 family metallopeptidase [Bacteroidota bacterium]